MLRHRTTDPACQWYMRPRGLLAAWRERRSHGRSCPVCMARDPWKREMP